MLFFMYLSGFSFAWIRPFSLDMPFVTSLKKRGSRLLIPFAAFGAIIILAKYGAQFFVFVDDAPDSLGKGFAALLINTEKSPAPSWTRGQNVRMDTIGVSASIEAETTNTEITACFVHISDLLGVLKLLKFSLNIALFNGHENFLNPNNWKLLKVSRGSAHIYNFKLHLFDAVVFDLLLPIMLNRITYRVFPRV